MSVCLDRWHVRVSTKARRWELRTAWIEKMESERRAPRRAGGVAKCSGTVGSSDGLRVPALAFPAGDLRMRAECQATEARVCDFFCLRAHDRRGRNLPFCRLPLSPTSFACAKRKPQSRSQSGTKCSGTDCT